METKIQTKPKRLYNSQSDDSILRNKTFLSRKRLLPFVSLEIKKNKIRKKIDAKIYKIEQERKKLSEEAKILFQEDEKDTIDELTNEGKKYLSLLLLLNSETSKKTSQRKTINVITASQISHKFLQQMSVDEFLLTLKKLINVIKIVWSEDEKQKAYDDLNKGIIASYICDDNSPIIQIKWDLLLTTFSEPFYNNKFVNILTPLSTIDLIPFPNVYNKKEDNISKYLNKKQLTKYLTSNALISVYYYVLKYRTNCYGVSKEVIKNKITDLVNKLTIFFCPLDKSIGGLTIYSGNIFIKKRYYDDYLKKTYGNIPLAVILITVFHEFMHVLYRSFRKIDNYYIRTEPKKIDSKEFDDSGDMVDYYLINSMEEYYKEESDYLLNEDNYLINYEGFRRGLLSIKKNITNINEQTPYPAKIIKKRVRYFKDGCKYSHK